MNKYISEVVYGGVDGLITTFAIIAGSSGANFSIKVLLILSISSIFADGFSMGISSYLAENVRINSKQNPYIVGLITFLSFIILGGLPLIPYLIDYTRIKLEEEKKEHYQNPLYYSILIMIILLMTLGYIKGGIKNSIRTTLIGGFATLISYIISKQLSKIK